MDFLHDSAEQAQQRMHLQDLESLSSARGRGSPTVRDPLAGPGRAFPRHRANSVSPEPDAGSRHQRPLEKGRALCGLLLFLKPFVTPRAVCE